MHLFVVIGQHSQSTPRKISCEFRVRKRRPEFSIVDVLPSLVLLARGPVQQIMRRAGSGSGKMLAQVLEDCVSLPKHSTDAFDIQV